MKDGWQGQLYRVNGVKRAKIELFGNLQYCFVFDNNGRETAYKALSTTRRKARAWCEEQVAE